MNSIYLQVNSSVKLKVLHITSSIQGGAGIAAVRLHKALIKSGVNSSVLSLSAGDKTVNLCKYDGVLKNPLLPPPFPELSLKNYLKERLFHTYEKEYQLYKNKLEEEKRLAKQIETDCINNKFALFTSPHSNYDITTTTAYKQADLIHLHWVAGFLDYPSFFAKNTKPVVWTLHDENPFRGGFHYKADESRNQTEYGKIDSEYKEVKKTAIQKQQKLTILTPSTWLKELANTSNLFSHRELLVINNTLDTSLFSLKDKRFCRDYLGIPEGVSVFLFAAQSVSDPRKGFDLLKSILLDEQFNNAHFIIVGDNIQNMNDARFHYLNQVKDERLMPLIYSAADAFILPSREDNLPNTMLESLCCGTPVISFSVGGMKEEIETGVNGILCGEVSEENLKQGLQDFMNGKYHFDNQKIAEQAHLKYAEAFIALKYLQVYKRIIAQTV